MIPHMLSMNSTVNLGLKALDGWCHLQFMDMTMEGVHVEIMGLLGSLITGKKLQIQFDGK
jgi:hypothetical protein